MSNIEKMTDAEVLHELELISYAWNTSLGKDQWWDALEDNLKLRAACLGWTGDPMRQLPRSVLAAALQVIAANADEVLP